MRVLENVIEVCRTFSIFIPLVTVFFATKMLRLQNQEATTRAMVFTILGTGWGVMLSGNVSNQHRLFTSLAALIALGSAIWFMLKAIRSADKEELQQSLVQAMCVIPCAIVWVTCS
ncbi:MAG: hypothetical protein A2W58_01865 [Candidatus Zambryskibacteria bacterium RIFCSPHIGHO2_02_38_10.5]|uniref:Uncharacterized protein n=1 Tax=Candidatus Zambryskibacteria bacterium RIFCSPHIGHO2_02_38_10.5 TaxID=1802742 RepID=A0A1G2TB93_9BACT|nr:MAG: hypothetical protein A2W58_01865 [Candidatus Zambryskibacteria bacterium RIFCSPHIGHO2_02_38_10.5]